MVILGIETSCDETAISIIETEGNFPDFTIKVLANEVLSQIQLHRQYGGVFPMLAKREHAKNLVPVFIQALRNANLYKETVNLTASTIDASIDQKREPELWEQFGRILQLEKPPIDRIAVTKGPGLEPTLWTGINFARGLSSTWEIPVVPINHMEGHIFASLLGKEAQISNSYKLKAISFPAISLLVSGGHTELVKIRDWFQYELLGSTRDDAAGEAFDKVARILGLPYPGGPEISRLAHAWRASGKTGTGIKFPRPMLKSDDYDFSYSGLKTSVLYLVKKLPELTPDIKGEIAARFEEAVVDSLVGKTKTAVDELGAQTLLVGGGVAANRYLRNNLEIFAKSRGIDLYISEIDHSTDNALMIALSGASRAARFEDEADSSQFAAAGNLKLV